MDRVSTNPSIAQITAPFSVRQLQVSEQDQYATAHLFRALAATAGHTAHNKSPEWELFFPDAAMEHAGLDQTGYLALRRSS
jgi:hypothetical protein